MTERQLRAIENHGQHLQAIFPKTSDLDPAALCRRLRRIEREAHAVSLAYCNGELDIDDWERESDRLLKKLDRVIGFVAAGVPVFVNGDARGYALKIRSEWASNAPLHRDWGGYGIIAPEIGPQG